MKLSVLLDTSFFVRLLSVDDILHQNTKSYFKYFLENEVILKVSTISIAEYCVRGNIVELPLKNIQILPFNLDQSIRTGKFADVIFRANSVNKEKLYPRAIIPNDAKLFAQADLDDSINYFVTSDTRSKKTFSALRNEIRPNFKIIDISTPYNEMFGILDL